MKAELLAPAGSYESMTAAFSSGADAVYIGGTRFGARAFADNLDAEALKRAIDYTHIRDKKLYLTVNTLVKETEMDELLAYLAPFYEEGLDAVIVQDLGALRMIREVFPDLDIHASTQMSITGKYGAKLLKEMGATRIVTARELSLEEIKEIHDHVDIEIESFIHGALCYCYSGQCLFSSMLGGRSGNRGRCAQPCRLPYDLLLQKSKKPVVQNKYLLSPKDICTLEILPEVLNSGVYSLKIEGRMKHAEYTAGVVRMYRKYLDMLETCGKDAYRVSAQDKLELLDLYNRGGFSAGYYRQHNGPQMMAADRPNHQGVKAAQVTGSAKDGVRIKALEALHKGDVLEMPDKDSIVLASDVKKNAAAVIKAPKKKAETLKNVVLWRTHNRSLIDSLKQNYVQRECRRKIYGKFILFNQKSAILSVQCGDIRVEVLGEKAQQAQNRPLTREDIGKQLKKTGGSEFVFDKLEIVMDDGLFLPLQSLNELRRNALEELTQAIRRRFRRESAQDIRCIQDQNVSDAAAEADGQTTRAPQLTVSLEDLSMLDTVCKFAEVDRIYLDCNAFANRQDFIRRGREALAQCRQAGKECYYMLPHVFRGRAAAYYRDPAVWETLVLFDGVLLRSIEEDGFLKEMGYGGCFAPDANLYTWNRQSRLLWRERGARFDTAAVEENRQELSARGCIGSEMIVYGCQPLMISAQCQVKNSFGCGQQTQEMILRDRKKKSFLVKNHCAFCYNTIYNGVKTELTDCLDEIRKLGPASVRLQFTSEDAKTASAVLARYIEVFKYGQALRRADGEFTRGHFERGVE